MKFEPEFKEVISQLSSKEKDKLIFRLLRRDHILANRLYFELLSTDSVLDRRIVMESKVKKVIEKRSSALNNPRLLLADMRDLSGQITEHVKITKDKYGEVSLNLLMLTEVLKQGGNKISKFAPSKTHMLCIYIIVRTFKILLLIKTLDEDYLIEFEDNLKILAQLIDKNAYLRELSTHNGLKLNWLSEAEIPDDIASIHKELRAKGFLRK